MIQTGVISGVNCGVFHTSLEKANVCRAPWEEGGGRGTSKPLISTDTKKSIVVKIMWLNYGIALLTTVQLRNTFVLHKHCINNLALKLFLESLLPHYFEHHLNRWTSLRKQQCGSNRSFEENRYPVPTSQGEHSWKNRHWDLLCFGSSYASLELDKISWCDGLIEQGRIEGDSQTIMGYSRRL